MRCEECGHEYLLAFSYKRRHFCPSCHQKRVVEFGEWVCEEVLKAVSHRHFMFSIPKILRKYFLYDRDLLSELSRCGWESVKAFFQEAMPEENVKPGTIIAIQSFGDFPGLNQIMQQASSRGLKNLSETGTCNNFVPKADSRLPPSYDYLYEDEQYPDGFSA